MKALTMKSNWFKLALIVRLFLAATAASADPQLTSWLTINEGVYARVYTTTNTRASGTSVTTWTGQSLPVYADVAQVSYSASWVYLHFTDMASYVMGPWLTPQGGQFMFWPTNQPGISKFPRSPTVPSSSGKSFVPAGYAGNYVNGVAIFNALDGKAWNGSALVSGAHTQPTYYWHRNAPIGEGFNFDYALGHQNPSGVYHTHQNPIALRYQLGDHVDYNSSTKNYSEITNSVTKHSPIIGWAYDGYPIYGPYGYSVSNNPNSGVRRMVCGYVERDGSNGTDEMASNLSTMPAWYARFRQNHFGGSYTTTAGTARPSVNSTYPLGTFAEDYSYLGDCTNPSTSQPYKQGTDFDLDSYNGRWCVTPDYPNGTYAYFVANDSSGNGVYPYVFGYEMNGTCTGNTITSITESVTTNYNGGANAPLAISRRALTNTTLTLTWTATEGGTYRIDSSTNLTTWTTTLTNIPAVLNKATTNLTKMATNQFYRVVRTGLASYDPN